MGNSLLKTRLQASVDKLIASPNDAIAVCR
jgi:hypothetical protein